MTVGPDLRLLLLCPHDAGSRLSDKRGTLIRDHGKYPKISLRRTARSSLMLIALSFALITATTRLPAAAEQAAKHSQLSNSQAHRQTLVIGRVSQHPERHSVALTQMANYLATKLGHLGITDGKAVIASDNAQMIKLLRDGAVDLVSETALSALLFEEQAGAKILLREWKKGVAQYHSIFFARADSGIQSLTDLRGCKIAFEDPGSTSSYILPLAALNKVGLPVVELATLQSPVAPTEVGFAFAYGELNIAMWVQRGLVCAGVLSNLDWQDIVRTPEIIKSQLVAFHAGAPFIRSLLVVRYGLRTDIEEAIRDALLGIHLEQSAMPVLTAYNKVTRYDEITGEAKRHLLEARSVFAYVRGTLDWMKPES